MPKILCLLGSIFFSIQVYSQELKQEGHKPENKPYLRTLISVSVDDLIDAEQETGVYQGTKKYLKKRRKYEASFYATLAAENKYLDTHKSKWEIIPISEEQPPACHKPQKTKYDAESCRYINQLFTDLDDTDPEKARRYRAEVRRGRDVWFKGTFGNQDFYYTYVPKILGKPIDYTLWLDTRHRKDRHRKFGLINDPDCKEGSEKTFWMDDCADPHSSGVVGFRKYLNRANAPEGYDPTTAPYEDGELAAGKRYKIGIACASCHVGFDPTNPPRDPANPQWENLMGGIGNQYINHATLFTQSLPENHFIHHLVKAQRPGTSDTSLIYNDFIHNPTAIPVIINLYNRPLFVHKMKDPFSGTIKTGRTHHFSRGGEDSAGDRLSLLKRYINMGMCSRECSVPNLPKPGSLFGKDSRQHPLSIKECSQNCENWNYADAKMRDLLSYLITIGPAYLAEAVDINGTPGSAYINYKLVPEGRIVYIENCARCHSDTPIPDYINIRNKQALREYYQGHIFGRMNDWEKEFPKEIRKSANFQKKFLDPEKKIPLQFAKKGHLGQDWLGNDQRVPYHEIGTNRCRAQQTNYLTGHIWEEFTSETYRESLSPGSVPKTFNALLPVIGGETSFFGNKTVFKNGVGYYRNISLLNIWNSAPFLHNNSLGEIPRLSDGTPDYTVSGRVRAFEQTMRLLLTSDNREITPHRELSVFRTNQDITLPARKDGKGLLGKIKFNVPIGSPIGYFASVNPHAPLFSQCDDYVENKGHQFGINLTEREKKALIEFVKTL